MSISNGHQHYLYDHHLNKISTLSLKMQMNTKVTWDHSTWNLISIPSSTIHKYLILYLSQNTLPIYKFICLYHYLHWILWGMWLREWPSPSLFCFPLKGGGGVGDETYKVGCIHDAIFHWQSAVNGELQSLLLLLAFSSGATTLRCCFL